MGSLVLLSLRSRDRQPELMDDPSLDEIEHRAALTGLRRVNGISRSAAILWPSIKRLARKESSQRLRILDIACGGGDVTVAIAARAAAAGIAMQVEGCDISPVAVQLASESAANSQLTDSTNFFKCDILNDDMPDSYDIVMCSLFLHHLSESDSCRLVKKMVELSRTLVLVNDLRRTRLGYALAWMGCRLLSRSPIVHVDGPLSVRAAYSIDEVRDLAIACGLADATITTHWPQRFLLEWNREVTR